MSVFIRTVLLGVADGSVYALAAIGLVLTFKTSGVLNFGYGGLVLFTTFVYWQLAVEMAWPAWLAAIVVLLLVAPLLGALLDTQLFRRIEGQPAVISVIATVGLAVLLQGIVFLIWGAQAKNVPSLFPSGTVPLPAGARIGVEQIGIVAVAAAAAGGLGALLRFTRMGVAFRAVVDNRSLAGLMAVNTRLVSATAWAMGTAFAALTGILLTPKLLLEPDRLPFLILAPVLGGAIVGYLRSLPLAYAGGLLIGIAQSLIIQYGGFRSQRLVSAVPVLVITAALLAAPKRLRLAGIGASFVVRTREVAVTASRNTRLAAAAAAFGMLGLVPALTSSISWRLSLLNSMTHAIVFLSLVVLTGYSGQISLGHTAFMGVAAFTMGHLVADLGVPVWIALALGPLAAAAAGAIVGVVAVRLHGLFLALMTLAVAFMAQELFFMDRGISGGEGGIAVPRPPGLESTNALYFLALAALIAGAAIAVNLRTGRTGRVLGAMRDSETAARSLGINVVKYKVIIFALSAFMAGFGGVLNAMILQSAGHLTYVPFFSLIYLAVTVLGGIFHVGGAIAAGMVFGLYSQLFGDIRLLGKLQLILFGVGASLALAQNPEGMFGEIRRGLAAAARLVRRRPRAEPLPVAGGQE